MTKVLIIITLLIIAVIIIFFFDRKNISEKFTNNEVSSTPTTTEQPSTTTPEPSTSTPETSTPATTTPETTTPETSTPATTPETSTPATPQRPRIVAPNYNDILTETNQWVKTNPIGNTPQQQIQPSTDTSLDPANATITTITPASGITDPQIMIPVGQQQQVPIKEVSKVDFLSVVLTYIPWGAYFAGNVSSDNILIDLLNRTEKNAVITGNITKNISSGNGAVGNISSILGTINTTIEFPNNSIPEKFTICSITRYTGAVNNKRILTAKNATPTNDWIHGHKSGQKGVVYYNEFKTNSSADIRLSGELTDWVITCAKNDGSPPNNIYINGSPSGIKSGGNGGLKLAINKIDNTNIINELSDFALSYVIIWDSCLSDKALKIVSDSLVKYLQTGEQLIFDMSSLSIDDKFKVLDSKSTFLKGEVDETNASLLEIKRTNTGSIANAISSVITSAIIPSSAEQIPENSSSNNIDEATQKILSIAAKAADKIGDNNDVKDLNPSNSKVTVNNVCNSYTFMPDPIDSLAFTESAENIPITSDNKSYQSYIWCKCNGEDGVNNNTDICKAYNTCRDNYSTYKNYRYEDQNVTELAKQVYENCKNHPKFKNTFPKYLEVNSLK